MHEVCTLHRDDFYGYTGNVRDGDCRDWYLLLPEMRKGHWVQMSGAYHSVALNNTLTRPHGGQHSDDPNPQKEPRRQ